MLGAIIGDIVGSIYEFSNRKSTDFPLFNHSSMFTDDTVMTIAVYAGIQNAHGNQEVLRRSLIDSMHKYGEIYPKAGYGGRFRQWLHDKQREPYGSYGNGSAMRVSSVGWLYDSLDDVERYAEISAAVSHNHPEGIKGAQAVASAIFMARTGATKEQIRRHIVSRYGYDLSRTLDQIRPKYEFSEICQTSVPEAIIAFLESENFEDAIRKAISLGGDSDTIGAITGSIAEAFYHDIPQWIVDEALSRLGDPLREIVIDFQDIYKHRSRGTKLGIFAKSFQAVAGCFKQLSHRGGKND